MNPQLIYSITAIALSALAIFLQVKFEIICDSSTANPRPYSFSRLQLLWWTCLVLAALVAIVFSSGTIPAFQDDALILLGIGSLTTVSARLIDISDATLPNQQNINVNQPRQGFWLDILSDNDGVSIHRLQAVIFNLVFGLWYIYQSFLKMPLAIAGKTSEELGKLIPVIGSNNLILLGLSAGTYITLKSTENKKKV